MQFTNHPEHKEKNDRVTCWSFGGIIEEREGCGSGWVFFDKMLTVGSAILWSGCVLLIDGIAAWR